MKIKNNKLREGFTILEAGLAVSAASVLLFSVLYMVTESMRIRMEADRISLAYTLASAKMTQILASAAITPADETGNFGDEFGAYSGYSYKLSIREETIDLAEYAGQAGGNAETMLADLLPPAVQNEGSQREKAGQSASTQTGAMVPVYKIRIEITYPRGNAPEGVYSVETIKETGSKF